MYVTQVAKRSGASADTIRYYSRIGILAPVKNEENGYRIYSNRDIRRLRFVRAAKALGFTLSEIRDIFSDADRGDSPCPRVRTFIERHIRETEQRLAELGALHKKMRQASQTWQSMEDRQPTSDSVCALIEALDCRE